LRVLAITKIFPNSNEPLSAPFNRQQFAALGRLCELEVHATIPWFPGAGAFGRWSSAGRLVDVPPHETIDGLSVHHPRFVYVPRGGLSISGLLYAGSLLPRIARRRGEFDVVLGSWAYPDGFAAVAVARALGVPAVVKLHGSDINVLGARAEARAPLRWALSRADAVVAVSGALGDAAVALGARADRIEVILNGVDQALFRPRDRREARLSLGLPEAGKLLLYVGRLEEEKGAIDLLEAFARLAPGRPDAQLVLVGGGKARGACEAVAARIGAQVRLVGPQPHDDVTRWLAACDALSLPSWNEGTPNVIIEALASGRRVVASRVGGIPALVTDRALGALVPARDVGALADALGEALDVAYDPAEVARLAGFGGWGESAARLHRLLERVVAGAGPRAPLTSTGAAGSAGHAASHGASGAEAP
jgi:teichuronic acid biosynthesis glycosyltransferase TuaC